MQALLSQAPKLGYIDGIMMTYNFRNMFTDDMKAAVDACASAGIGLTAMKAQAERSWLNMNQPDKAGAKLMESFIDQGLTEHQAKLKVVWTNSHIASICSQMPNMTILKANAAAAVDPTPLSSRQMHLFQEFARNTADQYCAGCTQHCENAVVDGRVPIADIMRYHMYCQSYGHMDWARAHFKTLAPEVRRQLAGTDFSAAERRCPQGMPIAKLMRKALKDFG
jgi:predicted aldo/keto reductase-like oxidoreductase